MRRIRLRLLPAMLVAAVVATVAPPLAAASSSVPELAGTVTLSGNQTGYVPVVIPTEARLGDPFFIDRRGSITVEGGGRMAGFALVQDGLKGPVIFGGHSAATSEFSEEFGAFVFDLGSMDRPRGLDFVLPAGGYRLYLLTDGAPTTVTLRFAGLEGSSELTPTTPTQTAVIGGPMRQHAPGVYTKGADTAMTGPFVHLEIAALRTSVHTESVGSFCSHEGKPAGPDPYLPGCASVGEESVVDFGNSHVVAFSDEQVGDSVKIAWGGAFATGPFHLGSGFNIATASEVTSADYSHFFLGLDPLPETGVPAARAIDDSCPGGRVPEDGFVDVPPTNPHESAVDCVVWWGVARGTAPLRYSPAATVTRGQMATFLVNTITTSGGTLAPADRDRFGDDNGTPHEDSINRLAQAGIVSGSNGRYAPDAPVSRAQMATFLVAAHEHRTGQALPSSQDFFSDDDGSRHEANINSAAFAGFSTGAGDGLYEPALSVERDQMASFIARQLDLLVEDGHAATPDNA